MEGRISSYFHSAGTQPRGVHPLTVQVLAELGVDISGATSKAVEGYLGQAFDYAITVCDQAREACPVFPGAVRSLLVPVSDFLTQGYEGAMSAAVG